MAMLRGFEFLLLLSTICLLPAGSHSLRLKQSTPVAQPSSFMVVDPEDRDVGKKTATNMDDQEQADLADYAFKHQLKEGAGFGDVKSATLKLCEEVGKRKAEEFQKLGMVMAALDVKVPKSFEAAQKDCSVGYSDYQQTILEDARKFEDKTVEKLLNKVDHPPMMEPSLKRALLSNIEQGQEAVAAFLWSVLDEDKDGRVAPDDVLASCEKAKTHPPPTHGTAWVRMAQQRAKELFLFSCTKCAEEIAPGKKFAKAFRQYQEKGLTCNKA